MTTKRDSGEYICYRNNNRKIDCPHGPAVRFHDGKYQYWINDKPHNIVGPVMLNSSNTKLYSINNHFMK